VCGRRLTGERYEQKEHEFGMAFCAYRKSKKCMGVFFFMKYLGDLEEAQKNLFGEAELCIDSWDKRFIKTEKLEVIVCNI
jgi:hypothetical protein